MSIEFVKTRFVLRDVRLVNLKDARGEIVFSDDDIAAIMQMENFLQDEAKKIFGTDLVASRIYGSCEGFVLDVEITPSVVVTKTNCYAQGLKSNVVKMLKSTSSRIKSVELEGGFTFEK